MLDGIFAKSQLSNWQVYEENGKITVKLRQSRNLVLHQRNCSQLCHYNDTKEVSLWMCHQNCTFPVHTCFLNDRRHMGMVGNAYKAQPPFIILYIMCSIHTRTERFQVKVVIHQAMHPAATSLQLVPMQCQLKRISRSSCLK